jgi:hypothetical protein
MAINPTITPREGLSKFLETNKDNFVARRQALLAPQKGETPENSIDTFLNNLGRVLGKKKEDSFNFEHRESIKSFLMAKVEKTKSNDSPNGSLRDSESGVVRVVQKIVDGKFKTAEEKAAAREEKTKIKAEETKREAEVRAAQAKEEADTQKKEEGLQQIELFKDAATAFAAELEELFKDEPSEELDEKIKAKRNEINDLKKQMQAALDSVKNLIDELDYEAKNIDIQEFLNVETLTPDAYIEKKNEKKRLEEEKKGEETARKFQQDEEAQTRAQQDAQTQALIAAMRKEEEGDLDAASLALARKLEHEKPQENPRPIQPLPKFVDVNKNPPAAKFEEEEWEEWDETFFEPAVPFEREAIRNPQLKNNKNEVEVKIEKIALVNLQEAQKKQLENLMINVGCWERFKASLKSLANCIADLFRKIFCCGKKEEKNWKVNT